MQDNKDPMKKPERPSITFRADEDVQAFLVLKKACGYTVTAVVNKAIREMGKREGGKAL